LRSNYWAYAYSKIGSKGSECAKLKITVGNAKAQPVIVTINKTGEDKEFTCFINCIYV
jgi:hypothetical protein